MVAMTMRVRALLALCASIIAWVFSGQDMTNAFTYFFWEYMVLEFVLDGDGTKGDKQNK
jgi:hypothetical protein